MGFFRRFFCPKKFNSSKHDSNAKKTRELELEKTWINGWNCKRFNHCGATGAEDHENISTGKRTSSRNSDFHFNEGLSIPSPIVVHNEGSSQTATVLQCLTSERKIVTSASPPLQRIPGALLSAPRFQEQFCTFLKDENVLFDEIMNQQPSSHSLGESCSIHDSLEPIENAIENSCACPLNVHILKTPSLVESVVPSLVCLEPEASHSTDSQRSSLTSTSYTSPSLTSSRSFFSSSSLPSSYFSKRHARKYHDLAPLPLTAKSLRKQEKDKTKIAKIHDDDLQKVERQEFVLPPVQHANKYVGSRSMSGPYPCITVHLPNTDADQSSQSYSGYTEGYYP